MVDYDKQYYLRNRDRLLAYASEYYKKKKDHRREYITEYRKRNEKELKKYAKEYYLANKDKISRRERDRRLNGTYKKQVMTEEQKRKKKEYIKLNRARINANKRRSERLKYYNDLNFRISCILRSRLSTEISGSKRGLSAVRDLGCSLDDFRNYIATMFSVEMTWENYGSVWHLDHIVPLSWFDLTNREQLKSACHFSNMQPLLASENLSKRNRFVG